VKLRTWETKED